jgi:hypothetical protein
MEFIEESYNTNGKYGDGEKVMCKMGKERGYSK